MGGPGQGSPQGSLPSVQENPVPNTHLDGDENGQDLVEYALLAALIALATVAALQTLSGTIGTVWTTISTRLSS